jgi:hypothetical protein
MRPWFGRPLNHDKILVIGLVDPGEYKYALREKHVIHYYLYILHCLCTFDGKGHTL